jgi:hypothetical protein
MALSDRTVKIRHFKVRYHPGQRGRMRLLTNCRQRQLLNSGYRRMLAWRNTLNFKARQETVLGDHQSGHTSGQATAKRR